MKSELSNNAVIHELEKKVADLEKNILSLNTEILAHKESDNLFQSTFNSSPAGITFSELNSGKLLEVNRSFLHFMGYTYEEAINKTVFDLKIWDSIEKRNLIINKLIDEGKIYNIEINTKNKNGDNLTILVSMEIVPYKGRDCILAIVYNITDRKINENLLKFHSTILNNIHDAVIATDMAGIITFCNKEAEEIFGFTYDEKIQSFTEKTHKEPSSFHAIFETLKTIPNYEGEWEGKRKDSNKIWLHIRANLILDSNGISKGYLVVAKNITDYKISQDNLKKSMDLMNEITSSSPGIVFQFRESASGLRKFTFISRGVSKMLFVTSDKIYTNFNNLFQYVDDTDRELLFDSLNYALKNKVNWDFNFKVINPEGRFNWISVQSSPNELQDGSLIYNGTFMDITGIKKYEEEVKAKNNLLQKSNFELDRFVYSVSHDLRSPLTSVMGLINIIDKKISDSDSGQKFRIGMLKKSIHKLDEFIAEILQYSRNSRLDITREKIDFNELIHEVYQNLRFMENAERINFKTQIEQTGIFHSDKKRIIVILNNLVSNSIKYFDESKPNPYLKVTVKLDAENAIIVVSDNGIGIENKYHDKIFDMFYRATEKATGSGLGMYIVKETLNRLGGTLALESNPSAGTEIKITIPNINQPHEI